MPTNSLEHREISHDATPDALQPLPPGVHPGAQVDLRGARWRVERTIARDDCCELHLTSESSPGRRVFLWPFDRPAPVERRARFVVARLRTWWRGIATAHLREIGPWTPRARHVRADVLPYQLEPAVAMARGTLRVVLADEVGLGKTVQAGWIVGDLVERERDARVLIAVPAGLRRQWQSELDTLFGLAVTAVDAAWLRAAVSDLPADVSPWAAPGIYLGSVDFLKRADVAVSLHAQMWDLLVVDEAHGATAPTDRHAALAPIAARSRRVVAITATPFSGDAGRFASLTALGAAPPAAPPVMFRRSREDTGDRRRRRHRFLPVRITRPEFRLQRMLERYSRTVWREAGGDVDGARLAVTILRKRALSSPAAAERSLRRRLALLQGSAAAPRQMSLFEDEETVDDDLHDAALAVPGIPDVAREHRWLAAMIDAASAAASGNSKQRRLVRLLERARGEAVIVFTEYRDTLRHLSAAMPGALQLHGGLSSAERVAVQRRFNETGGWLLATDAASEGLNLQQRCRLVVNYELPWNPARLEQRIGRIDRIGQQRFVHAISLVARDTAEDLVVANLTKRLARIAATLGERDRLAAFLDDARIARRVIGSEEADPIGLPIERIEGTAPPSSDLKSAGVQAANELLRRPALVDAWIRAPIASLRAVNTLPPGYVVALRCAAETRAGQVIAERLVVVHVPAAVERPSCARQVHDCASVAVARLLPHVTEAVPDLAGWFAAVARVHANAMDAQIARESAIRGRRVESAPVQRGLFDRRAAAAADRQSACEAALFAASTGRIRDLERGRALQMTVTPTGVLVLWR